MTTSPKLLTVAQVAAQLGVHVNTVRNWADRGYLAHVKLPSGYRRFTQDEVDRVLTQMRGGDDTGKAAA